MYLRHKLILSIAVLSSFLSFNAKAIIVESDNFESGFGSWSNVSNGDNKDWSRDSGGTTSSGTGPSGGAGGSSYYVYLETSSGFAYTAGDTAILQSPAINASDIHLSFDYHMFGADMGTLAVDVLSGGSWVNNVWIVSGQQQTSNTAQYASADIDLSAYSVSQLRFRATAAGGYWGDMALDNIEIASLPSGPVAPAFVSDPLTKADAYQDQSYSGSISVDASDGNGDPLTFSKVSGPSWLQVGSDGSLSGTPSSSDVGDNSFVVQASDGSLSSTATLTITVNDDSTPILLSSSDFESGMGEWANITGVDNKDWTLHSGGTPSSGTGPSSGAGSSTYYLYLETSSGSAYTADDTAILQGPAISAGGIHLKFDYHMYGANTGTLAVDVLSGGSWIQDVWTISGQQQTSNTAQYASADIDLSAYSVSQLRFRATAAGGYWGDMALDNIEIASLPSGPVAPAFVSDPLTKADAYQDQSYSGSISVDASDGNGDPLTFSKVSGPSWLQVGSDGSLSGTPSSSDVGDNSFVVQASDGSLSSTATMTITVQDGSAPIILSSSNFESNMGDWANVVGADNKDWTRHSGTTPSSGTGPSTGAASSTYYLYLETSSGFAYTAGDTAILQSAPLSASNVHVKFDYHMYGSDMGALAVDVLSGGNWINDVWTIAGQQHSSNDSLYVSADIDLSAYSVSQLRLRATAVGGYLGDMAIDNLEIYSLNLNAIDTDGDGVVDANDQCPATPSGKLVDGNGCAASQRDSDNDGYFDDVDVFPYDPSEWSDSDLDGIGDNADADDDNDGVDDSVDAFPYDAGEWQDTDGDGIGNNSDSDDDGDGLTDADELSVYFTDPLLRDTDGDGMDDGWEVQHGLNPTLDDAEDDLDGDGYSNLEEFASGSDPVDASSIPLSPISGLSLSTNSSCAIVDNQITCWGLNTYLPVPSHLSAAEQVAHTNNGFCALQGNNVTCWGESYLSLVTDIQTTPIDDAVELSVATLGGTGCVITLAGDVRCWGSASYNVNLPPNTLSNVQKIDMLQYHACSHDRANVECWGRNDHFQSDVPIDLDLPLDIAVGGLHTCVLQVDHQVRCWGDNSQGQTSVPLGLGNVVSIDAGYYHTCALNDVGDVKCWGSNSNGQQAVPANLTGVSEIISGPYNVCATANGQAVCWGKNDYGQSSIWYNLADFDVGEDHVCGINGDQVMCFGTTINEPTLLDIPQDINSPKVIGLGRYHSCVWADSGMHCWGRSTNNLNPPGTLSSVTEIQADSYQTCAIDNGSVVCWGSNNHGLLNVPTNLNQPRLLSAGQAHNCVIDGATSRCWGDNYYDQSTPRYNLLNPTAIAAGGMYPYPNSSDSGHTCLADDIGVQCWGSSKGGVLNVPSNLNDVIELHAGWGTSCALQSSGVVTCWGDMVSQQSLQHINTGAISQMKGHHSQVCARGPQALRCTKGEGALLID
ncbi:putative Ig domain-containing protein [Microbulbifer rhizosphaerae]|uniref:Alpha-tubulin suppressor-like RCC1 family protein n=1 Tax=Microbulbifer rhizosphaerae TaxID=1562603 RepID=A0A7W4W7Q6_9GAMM|nr:putative Ig domain-containing protein [Microbulbifer rhizosphaerae]MBB3059220.1 alpha-tubulin suppressor-like RCC1 family protein [Microbulbifer rhizosphaerae]